MWALKFEIDPDSKTVSSLGGFIIFAHYICKSGKRDEASHAGSTYAISILHERHGCRIEAPPTAETEPGATARFEVTGHNGELWLRKLSWSQKWCVWSLIRCLQNTTSWTPTLPDRISQGWKIIASENYVIFRHHDHENYVVRVIEQECPRAWWCCAWLVGVFCVILSNLKHKNLQMLLAKLSICHIWTSKLVPAHNHSKLIMFQPSLSPSLESAVIFIYLPRRPACVSKHLRADRDEFWGGTEPD